MAWYTIIFLGAVTATIAANPVESLAFSTGDRRALLKGTASATISILGSNFSPQSVSAADTVSTSVTQTLTVPRSKAVVVLGAGGKTGQECVAALLGASRPCIATTRSGDFSLDGSSAGLTTASADVTSLDSLSAVIGQGDIGAVIFAASASTKGGDAMAVDRDGVINAARACIANDVSRLIIVSSGTVTRPDSAVYKLLNFVGKGIMEAKIVGEDGVREMYSDPELVKKGVGYTVIRPGGLTTGASLGAAALELNQGDGKSGRLSRADVAELCINCLDSSDSFDATFECYEASTAKPVESVGLSNIMKSTDATTYKSGREQLGENWDELFRGLVRDPGHEA